MARIERGRFDPASPWSHVLVTGGAGFIGTHLCPAIRREWPEAGLVVLDHRPLAVDCHFRQGARICPDTFQSACQGVGCVFHLAAMISVEESWADSSKLLRLGFQAEMSLSRGVGILGRWMPAEAVA